MLATFIAYIMSGQHNSIFRSQVLSRSESPAHRREYQRVILSDHYVKDVMKNAVSKMSKEVSLESALQMMNRNNSKMIAVVNENDRLEGVVYKHKLYEFPEEYRKSVVLESVMTKDPFFVYMSDSLHNALVRLSSNELQEMPVLSDENNKVLGIITLADLVKLYDNEVEKVVKLRDNSNLSTVASDKAINKGKVNQPDDKSKS